MATVDGCKGVNLSRVRIVTRCKFDDGRKGVNSSEVELYPIINSGEVELSFCLPTADGRKDVNSSESEL